ncbi:hypothetical protein JYU34_000519 [Plutella xylostella]|uniref:Protein SCAI n=1 Tax=Plutella xylostella TaxID=51655 RepID=A0ABQ7R7Y5_PLUXY|nr:hypothetical protein JYU34_000519 [Plutella xylostella]
MYRESSPWSGVWRLRGVFNRRRCSPRQSVSRCRRCCTSRPPLARSSMSDKTRAHPSTSKARPLPPVSDLPREKPSNARSIPPDLPRQHPSTSHARTVPPDVPREHPSKSHGRILPSVSDLPRQHTSTSRTKSLPPVSKLPEENLSKSHAKSRPPVSKLHGEYPSTSHGRSLPPVSDLPRERPSRSRARINPPVSNLPGEYPSTSYARPLPPVSNLPGEQPSTSKARLPGEQPSTSKARLPGEQPSTSKTRLPGERPSTSKARLPGEQPSTSKTRLPGEQPSTSKARLPGEQPSTSKVKSLPPVSKLPGEYPSKSHASTHPPHLDGEQPSTSKARCLPPVSNLHGEQPSTSKARVLPAISKLPGEYPSTSKAKPMQPLSSVPREFQYMDSDTIQRLTLGISPPSHVVAWHGPIRVVTYDDEEYEKFLDAQQFYAPEESDFNTHPGPSHYRRRGLPPGPLRLSDSSMVGSHANLTEHERKVIIEFCHLLEKSKQLFNGLRDLPQYGHKQWYAHFGRTFDVYTKIWKYQQQHRETLDMKYGLKRWQIGEIASKIGQLYYHFYLRTSETAYLNEAYSFYYAIRGRSYYTKAVKEDRSDLMVKKLRYYARFIVVCLLLKKMKLVRELIKELVNQIVDYGNTYDPEDQMEWSVVVDEVKSFVKAEPAVMVLTDDNFPVTLSHRLTALTSAPVERSHLMTLTLEEIVIIGSRSEQVKFSELTMDMFRILQTLERESREDFLPTYDGSPRARGYPSTPGAPAARGSYYSILFYSILGGLKLLYVTRVEPYMLLALRKSLG